MSKQKDVPLIISCLQLLALKEILQSPSFEAKNEGELKWLFDLIDKVATIDAVSTEIWKEWDLIGISLANGRSEELSRF